MLESSSVFLVVTTQSCTVLGPISISDCVGPVGRSVGRIVGRSGGHLNASTLAASIKAYNCTVDGGDKLQEAVDPLAVVGQNEVEHVASGLAPGLRHHGQVLRTHAVHIAATICAQPAPTQMG